MPNPPRQPTPPVHAEDDLASLDAVDTAAAIAAGQLGSHEAFEAAVTRAEQLDPQLGALATLSVAEGRKALAAGDPSAPLHGVPTAIKDLSEQAGIRTTFGSLASGTHISPRTDPPVAQLLATGLVSIGKSAAPEYGMTPTAETPGFVPTRNPWDPGRTSGGSSSGAGALVAAGIVPVAHGSDGGGSIRIPAACCGLVGLKPSRGRLAEDPTASQLPVRVVSHGVLTRTVRDTIAYLRAAEAVTPPTNLPVLEPIERPSASRRRIGVVLEAPATTVDPQVVAATRRTADDLAALGHHVEEVEPPFGEAFGEDFLRYWGLLAQGIPLLGLQQVGVAYRPGRLDPWTKGLARHARRQLLAMPATIRRLRRMAREHAAFMADVDVLLTPTLGQLPPELGWLDVTLPFEVHRERVTSFVPFTPAFNVSGAPAVSVPVALSREGLPVGIQLGGRFAEDAVLLELALEIEAALGFNRPLPD